MAIRTPNRWQEVSPYLDLALDVPDEERGAWLTSFCGENPELGELLAVLLDEYRELAKKQFLERGPDPLTEPTALAGQTVGAYTLLSQIGQGGMGSVWLAERSDGRFERQVAVKFLNSGFSSPVGEQRFKREGSILGRLSHPHIAKIMDAGVSDGGQPYLVLEHVDGQHIDCFCDDRSLDIKARVRLFLDVVEAVAHAHSNLIVHRDLKPSNVLVRQDGQVRLLDFGIAKLLKDEAGVGVAGPLTLEDGRFMTPEYASPEQLKGESVTTGTDVYSLGVLLYVLLTGQHPAGSGPHSPADLIKAIVDTESTRPSDTVAPMDANRDLTIENASKRGTTPDRLRRLLRGDLDNIAAKALKKNPQERYPSATAFAEDLRRYLGNEPVSARPDTLAYRAVKFIRRNRAVAALATLAAVATAAGVTGTLIQARAARTQRDFALRQLSRVEAINDLDTFLLADAPSSKPFTVNELLAHAEHVVGRQRDTDLANRAELFISIGSKYEDQDQYAKAQSLIEEAYRLTRGLSDPSARARASCALANVLSRSDLPRAESLIQEGLRELPAEPQFVLDRVSCFTSGSSVAIQQGASKQAIARSQGAQQLLTASPLHTEIADLRVAMVLAEAYRSADRLGNAASVFERASTLMSALGRDDTETDGTLLNNWALTLHTAGRPLEAEKLFRRAIEISRTTQTEQDVSPMLLINYARTLRELGRTEEAVSYGERALSKSRQAGDQVITNQSLMVLARIYREEGDLRRSEALISEVEPRLKKSLPPGHEAFAVVASLRSLVAVSRGDLLAGLHFSNQALAIEEASVKSGGAGADYVPYLLLGRSDIERRLGRLDDATADAATAVTRYREVEGEAFSGQIGHAYYTLGLALQAQGKHDEAQLAFRSAVENLVPTLGPDHPDTRGAKQQANADSQSR